MSIQDIIEGKKKWRAHVARVKALPQDYQIVYKEIGRRSVCYDREALESRKEHKPQNNAIGMAADMGIEILTEEQYRELQKLGNFDMKTSSWVKTPDKIRKLGGAIFCDRRYDTVFVYHNGAESYYASRGFRGSIKV